MLSRIYCLSEYLGPRFRGDDASRAIAIRYFFILASIEALIVACRLRP